MQYRIIPILFENRRILTLRQTQDRLVEPPLIYAAYKLNWYKVQRLGLSAIHQGRRRLEYLLIIGGVTIGTVVGLGAPPCLDGALISAVGSGSDIGAGQLGSIPC